MKIFSFFFLCLFCLITPLKAEPRTSLSRFGTPKYADGFTHFNYLNPNAPKGGRIVMGTIGTFDSVNYFSVIGIKAESLLMTADQLMCATLDDPHSLYGLIAQTADLAPDNSSITFALNPKAVFQDGSPITTEDIKFTIETLRDQGYPVYRNHYSRIEKITLLNAHEIKIDLKKKDDGTYDPELPLCIARLRVLSKRDLEGKDFKSTGLTPMLSSGPYKIKSVSPARSIVYELNDTYWAKDLPVNKGRYNFKEIVIDYYKNAQTQFEAFKAGEFDCFFEADQKQWHTAYDFAALKDGRVVQVANKHKRPVTVRTFIFNVRRPLFQDLRVRKALTYAFDFETCNRLFFYDGYERMTSLFANTHFVSTSAPSDQEKTLAEPFKEKIDPAVLTGPFELPKNTCEADIRENLNKADALLKEAGYVLKNGKRVHQETGKPLEFEFMIKDQRLLKVVLAYQKNLAKLGVKMTIRQLDVSPYEKEVVELNFDMIAHAWTNSLSPGIEQQYYFSVKNANVNGSTNYIGVSDPQLEELAFRIGQAKTEEELITSVKAFDRVVMGMYLMVPVFYDNGTYFSYWKDRIEGPAFDPAVGTNVIEWWWTKKDNTK